MADFANNDPYVTLLANVEQMKVQYNIAVSPYIEFRANPVDGIGIHANQAISRDSILIEVPFSSVLTTQAVTTFPPLQGIFEDNPGLLDYPDEVLCIGLLYALHHDSPWTLHVSTMPRVFSTPLYWTEEELSLLRGHNVYHLTMMMRRQIQGDFSSIYEGLRATYPDSLGQVTIEEYMWALSVVYSRALDVTRRGKHIRLIAPLLDMANHDYFNRQHDSQDTQQQDNSTNAVDAEHESIVSLPKDTFDYNEQKDTVIFKAGYEVSGGKEVYAVYGAYPNSQLLYTYGFVCLHNPFKQIDVWTKLVPTNSFYTEKNALMERYSISSNYMTYDFKGTIRNTPPHVTAPLLNVIRTIQCDGLEELRSMEELLRGAGVGARGGPSRWMVSVRNELATYNSLLELLQARMRPQDAETDRYELGQLLLNDTPLTDKRVHALIIITEERELLRDTIAMVREWVQRLQVEQERWRPVDAAKVATDVP